MNAAIPIVDCHSHLGDGRIAAEIKSIFCECASRGVQRILINGTCPEDWRRTLELAFENGYDAALGLHPFNAALWNDSVERQLRDCISDGRVCAIGEIGLDGTLPEDSFPQQKLAFSRQLAIAAEADLPVALHLRRAWPMFFALLSEMGIRSLRGYCHNFTGSWEIGKRILNLGLCLSFNTSVLSARKVLETVANAPLDCILTETDAPDMPFGHEPKRPWHAAVVLEKLAQTREMPLETLAYAVLANYSRLFQRG